MDIVINASPLILLDKIDRLPLLNDLFDTVYIPSSVLKEVQTPEIVEAKINLSRITFIHIEVVNKIAVQGLLGRLHIGEAEVMIGAIENEISTVILDDNAARNKAKQLGLHVTGTLGILLKANKYGLVTDLQQEIVNLKNAGIYLSDEIIKKIVTSLGLR
jgi:predicted nucleic acid-binding protein